MKRILLLFLCLILLAPLANAAPRQIIYIPHDDRPISLKQTVENAEAAGITVLLPPRELLGSRTAPGNADGLWTWLGKHIKKADALVLSADALIYGSLVSSRKHDLDQATIDRRVNNFAQLKERHPGMTTYVFASVMRSPRASEGGVEPPYYERYGPKIFAYTALLDKAETKIITDQEKKEMKALARDIPPEHLDDWLARRKKNLTATLRLVDMAKADRFKYLIVGRDDNAPYSQTRRECRILDAQSGDLGKSRYQSVPGVDELGLLMLTRSITDLTWKMPLAAIDYAPGIGAATIPTYSDVSCGESIQSHLFASGALPVRSADRAELILVVNTDRYGRTYEAAWDINDGTITQEHRILADKIEKHLAADKKVALADIKYANGADNGLMAHLAERKLLDRLYAYSGWNTADNSLGFVIAQSVLAEGMTERERREMLTVRLLDDWAYQANIRQYLQTRVIDTSRGDRRATSVHVQPVLPRLIAVGERRLILFTRENMPSFGIRDIDLAFPWDRTFEADFTVHYKETPLGETTKRN